MSPDGHMFAISANHPTRRFTGPGIPLARASSCGSPPAPRSRDAHGDCAHHRRIGCCPHGALIFLTPFRDQSLFDAAASVSALQLLSVAVSVPVSIFIGARRTGACLGESALGDARSSRSQGAFTHVAEPGMAGCLAPGPGLCAGQDAEGQSGSAEMTRCQAEASKDARGGLPAHALEMDEDADNRRH